MNNLKLLSDRLDKALEVRGIHIPCAGIKIYKKNKNIPHQIKSYEPDGMAITSCHALRSAMLDDAVYLSIKSMGCPAAAVSLGMVNKDDPSPLKGRREYTDIMKKSSNKGENFVPPSPNDFSNGSVYTLNDTDKNDYALFGKKDSGRFKKKEIAKHAIDNMPSLKPNETEAIFYFSNDYYEIDITPDIVILSLRPVELCRIIQGYQYLTGERIVTDFSGLRAGCSDLIALPLLKNKINISPYCLGARLIAKFEGDRMGIGFPFSIFETIVKGCEESKTGFPFLDYPDSSNF